MNKYKNLIMFFSIISLIALFSVSSTLIINASENPQEINFKEIDTGNQDLNDIWQSLSPQKQLEFKKLFVKYNISYDKQLEILQSADANSNSIQSKWKTAVIRKALEYSLKYAGKQASASWLYRQTLKINGTTTNIKYGISNALVSIGVPRRLANVAASVAVAIFF